MSSCCDVKDEDLTSKDGNRLHRPPGPGKLGRSEEVSTSTTDLHLYTGGSTNFKSYSSVHEAQGTTKTLPTKSSDCSGQLTSVLS